MYFKDKAYYISKIKSYLGIACTALAFDASILFIIWFCIIR